MATAGMKIGFAAALVTAACIACMSIQAQNGTAGASSSSQNNSQQTAPQAPAPVVPQSQAKGNPFPGNTNNVPILPSGPTANIPEGAYEPNASRSAFPPQDRDPVRSPDNTEPDNGNGQGFSSSLTGVDDILPPPSQPSGGKNDQQIAPMPQVTPENDISVGNYYLSVKNWRAALSRFQSALVLEPENPDVYWGLAESERHLGDFAAARQHYLQVLVYDPGSKHSKEAKKALRDPEIANAKPAPSSAKNTTQP